MSTSTSAGLALLEAGLLLAVSVAIRGFCARRITVDMVPAALRPRVLFSDRLTPALRLVAGAMVAAGALLSLVSG
jgi:hypothetical protein